MPLKIIWLAMMMSLAIYLVVAFLAGPGIGVSMSEETLGILRLILYVLAFITLIAIRFVKTVVLSNKIQSNHPTQDARQTVFQRYQSATIVALALSESIGIYGLVLFLIGKNTLDLYLLIIISAVAMFMYRPSMHEVSILMQESEMM
jgi:hypothetical protein